jgi:beta-galactosidase/beta-glucuronidase
MTQQTRKFGPAALLLGFAVWSPMNTHAQYVPKLTPAEVVSYTANYGPYNGRFVSGGEGLQKPIPEHDSILKATSAWTFSCWIKSAGPADGPVLIAGLGDPSDEDSRYLALIDGKLAFRLGENNLLTSSAAISPDTWHFIAASFDGNAIHLFSDGAELTSGKLLYAAVAPVIELAPDISGWPPIPTAIRIKIDPEPNGPHFGGVIAAFTIQRTALDAAALAAMYKQPPGYAAIEYEDGSKPWPVQVRQQAGYHAPDEPWMMPTSAAPFSKPVEAPLPPSRTTLKEDAANQWTLSGGWKLAEAPKVSEDGASIAQTSFHADHDRGGWMAATVPGTVLTTMIDRGIYPDPDYGLNNMAIPESLNKQDYWYRSEFTGPKVAKDEKFSLIFEGINYKAEVWLNGQDLGMVKGAFIRGVFDVTGILKPGQPNALAVRISPPPHPGIPNEESIKGGPGENGGLMCIDGPTFVASEGWDWIPGIRDRDSGIWQDVKLVATGNVKIGDPNVVTTLPLPDNSSAKLDITVPLKNTSSETASGTLTASFEGVSIKKDVKLTPGDNTIELTPAEFAELAVKNPRLWWPNGYGKPDLYHLKLSFAIGGVESDSKQVQFGIREISYELSLLDNTGHLRRVEYAPALARTTKASVVDVSHDGMRHIPGAWVASIAKGEDASPAFLPDADLKVAPYLIIKVNGVRIAARGGNWGMDDSRKRVSREKLEPYFRLHRDANVNIIRNWVGQDTEATFFDLADEYGMMVWNDFWDSTQDYNAEPEDPQLFLANAKDVILRFRNHPSIVMWCGRNEGVPQPILTDGLAYLTHTFDGTRYYSPSSNRVNLQDSGPYHLQNPVDYYTKLNHGFSVETGTASFSTLESFQHWIPKADQWPISDDWAYHDWHQEGNGDAKPFMRAIEEEFGASTSLEDFERKAQMFNYVDHRAIFEGMNAHLWAPNSGRMLWMTQPAWPSNMWQILSSDYDTQASFYGTKKACEPIHVQLDLSNFNVDVIDTTNAAAPGLTVSARVYSLDNKVLLSKNLALDAKADAMTPAFQLELAPLLIHQVVLIRLELKNSAGQVVSNNFYWLAGEESDYRALSHLPAAPLSATATATRAGGEMQVHVHLQNSGTTAALTSKLTLENAADGERILPAYYSDNYVSLLPGEAADITISAPENQIHGASKLGLRGWNITTTSIPIQ